jgi:23S rRNA (uracil1939-C5)-methyltransferase
MDRAAPWKFPEPMQVSCPHARECPGCPLLDLDYPAQLARKQALLRTELGAYPELAPLALETLEPAARIQGYRARAKLVAAGGALGLFARGTHRVVDTPDCRVLDPLVAQAVTSLRALLPEGPALDGIDVARAGDALLVTLIAPDSAPEAALRTLGDALRRALPAVAGIALARRPAGAVQLLGAAPRLLSGAGELPLRSSPGGPYSYLAPGAFTQAHADTSSAIQARIGERLAASGALRGLRVLELFAGSGALALTLAARGAEVSAVESFAPACERLRRAAREQALPVRVLTGDAARQTRALADAGERFDVVLVNPPRRGLEPALRVQLAALGAAQIGYVSCRPSSLARDLAHFARLGYGCRGAGGFDMMPQTDQLETLAWLVPAEPPLPRPVHADEQLIALNKPALESVEVLAEQLRRASGCAQARAVSALAAGSSGLVLFAASAAAEPRAAELTNQLEWSFVALVKGVVRRRGALPAERGARYHRLEVAAGHSLVRVQCASDDRVLRAFRRLGHPVVGDAQDAATAKHFALRHGLERPFVHASAVQGRLDGRELALQAPLAPDLASVLASMGAASAR